MDEPMVWTDDLEPRVCWRLLQRAVVGRIAFLDDGLVKVLPVNHMVDGETIVLRTDHDSSLASVARGAVVAFEVDGMDEDRQTGWSVVLEGVAERTAPEAVGTAPEWLHPWAPGPKDLWVRVVPSAVTGRAISRLRGATDAGLLPYMPPD
jgi:uncharacterized protein